MDPIACRRRRSPMRSCVPRIRPGGTTSTRSSRRRWGRTSRGSSPASPITSSPARCVRGPTRAGRSERGGRWRTSSIRSSTSTAGARSTTRSRSRWCGSGCAARGTWSRTRSGDGSSSGSAWTRPTRPSWSGSRVRSRRTRWRRSTTRASRTRSASTTSSPIGRAAGSRVSWKRLRRSPGSRRPSTRTARSSWSALPGLSATDLEVIVAALWKRRAGGSHAEST